MSDEDRGDARSPATGDAWSFGPEGPSRRRRRRKQEPEVGVGDTAPAADVDRDVPPIGEASEPAAAVVEAALETSVSREEESPPEPHPAGKHARRWRFERRHAPLVLVAAAIVFNLWTLRAELQPVQNLNDSSVHASMVRWAQYRIENGHVPLDGWYPYLSLGASRFHHYQSLPHILTGYASVVFGERTYQWSLYLLLCFWPIAVYGGGRLMELERWPAAIAALLSPLIVSTPGLGYEYSSYVWRGSGLWTQLWGMWVLPIAWGLGWKAVSKGRSYAITAGVIALTIVLHLLTGYLALLSLGVFVLLRPTEILRRIGRAVLVGVGALLAASWMLVPLLTDARWATQDEFSRNSVFYDSFGARRILGWAVRGDLFDAGRLPVITAAVAAGIVVCGLRFRDDERARAVLGVGLLSLLLFFGRPTLGPVIDLLPGGGDLFLRRYIMGVHLAGLFLAGWGAFEVGRFLILETARLRLERTPALVGGFVLVALVLLLPAWRDRAAFHDQGGKWIEDQRLADESDGFAFGALVDEAERRGEGRIFSGLRSSGDAAPRIGQVPTHVSLLNEDADAIGFTRPTWSLASNVESRFDPTNPAHFDLFNVRYVILPIDLEPVVPAMQLRSQGRFTLWQVKTTGYLRVVDSIAPIAADRSTLGQQTESFLSSGLPAQGQFPTIAFDGERAPVPTLGPGDAPADPAGQVVQQLAAPADGFFAGDVVTNRPAVVLLKASFDPRWRVSVDGYEASPQMIAPGFVGRTVGPGPHRITFTYEPYPWYPVLFAVGALALAGLALITRAGGWHVRGATRVSGDAPEGIPARIRPEPV